MLFFCIYFRMVWIVVKVGRVIIDFIQLFEKS